MTRRLSLLLMFAVVFGIEAQQQRPKVHLKGRYSGNETVPSAVGVIPDVVLRDNDRNKDVVLTIEYPTRGGPHPLIVFSHGFRGSNRGYVGLSSYWAGSGYVVIRPTHADGPREVKLEDIWSSQTPADFRNRVRDITLILDELDTLETRYPELRGKIDREKIGIGGHSYGAHTSMLAAGVRTFPGPVTYADPRVKAIVAMSPQGPSDVRGLTRESWTELRAPALFLTGTEDNGVSELETYEWRRNAYELAPAGDKWLLVIEGARHGTFTGRADAFIEAIARESAAEQALRPDGTRAVRPPSRAAAAALHHQEMFAAARGLSLAFWDTYLKSDAKAREALEKAGERKGLVVERK